MELLVVVALIVLADILAVAGVGHDSRDGSDWKQRCLMVTRALAGR